MTHALPDLTPDPPTVPTGTRSNLFTLTFWLATVARTVRGAATGAMSMFGTGEVGAVGSVSWVAVGWAALIGAVMSIGASLSAITIPTDTITTGINTLIGGRR